MFLLSAGLVDKDKATRDAQLQQKASDRAEKELDAQLVKAEAAEAAAVKVAGGKIADAAPEVAIRTSFVKAGKLWKKGQFRKNWSQRWFVLHGNPGNPATSRIEYFAENDGERTLKGTVEFTDLRNIRLSTASTAKTGSSDSTEWRFRVVSGDRTLDIAAPTERDMMDWLSELSSALGVPVLGENS